MENCTVYSAVKKDARVKFVYKWRKVQSSLLRGERCQVCFLVEKGANFASKWGKVLRLVLSGKSTKVKFAS